MELGSAPATVLFVPMPRMVTCASPVCCEIVTRRHEAGEAFDRLDSQLLERPGGKHGHGKGVDWISAAPVFVAVTVIRSENEATRKDHIERRRTALNIDLGGPRLEPAERGRDQVAACGERIELVSAVHRR